MAKIMLDPGHGGIDPGAVGYGTREADVNLAVAWRVYHRLMDAGQEVWMTREDDYPSTVGGRVAMANACGADAYISIHCNAFTSASAHGTETLVRANATDDDRRLAKVVQRHMVAALGRKDRGVKVQDLGALRDANMPCCLVELAFITHQDEHDLLVSASGQERAAEAICAAVLEWFGIELVVPDVRVMIDGAMTDIPTRLIDDQTWVPLRWIAEELGCRVDWDGETRIAKVDREG